MREPASRRIVATGGSIVLLLAVLVPTVLLDVEWPFLAQAGLVLAAGAGIFGLERWEDRKRASRRWQSWRAWLIAGFVAVVVAIFAFAWLAGA